MSETKRSILVAGAQGVIGQAAAEYFSALPDSGSTTGCHAQHHSNLPNVRPVKVDLLSVEWSVQIAPLNDVTHIIFAAYIEKDTPGERSKVNVALLRNLLTVVERSAPGLKHVTLYQGGKAYGADLGPFKTPAREDDPRLMSPNFYYDQEDFLRTAQAGKKWSFSILRPEAVCGYAVGNPMNLTMVIAIYAAISKEMGLPLRFPGPEGAYRALYQVTSADILARAADWAGETPSAANEIFNITNGDYFRWQFSGPGSRKPSGWKLPSPFRCP